MIIPQVDRLSKVKLTALCTVIALFVVFLAIGTTWGGGGEYGHTSPTGQCTVCHGTSLTTTHQVAWSTTRTGCYICHPSGRRTLYTYLAGATFNCLTCHALSPSVDVPVDYHMNIDTKHISTEAVCMKCHSIGEIPIASLPQVHEDLGEAEHLPLTVTCPSAVSTIADDIYCYCLECHKNPVRIPTFPTNANCTSCHEAVDYNAKLNLNYHKLILEALQAAGIDTNSHKICTDCHVK